MSEFTLLSLPDLIGCLGTFIVLVAYALLQVQKLNSDGILFSLLNLIASTLILISLYYAWNFAAVMMETSWGVISLYGVVKGIISYSKKSYNRPAESEAV